MSVTLLIHFSLSSVISLKFQCYSVMWHKITISDHYKSEMLDGLYICMCRRMGPTLVTCSRLELWNVYSSSVCCGFKTVPLLECGSMIIRDQTEQFGHGFAVIFVLPSSGSSLFLLLLGKATIKRIPTGLCKKDKNKNSKLYLAVNSIFLRLIFLCQLAKERQTVKSLILCILNWFAAVFFKFNKENFNVC